MGNFNENDLKNYAEVLDALLLQSSKNAAKISTLLDIQAQILAKLEGRDLGELKNSINARVDSYENELKK
ncbi:hypothetical protein [Pedobacter nutrimenti]|jgi:hypothetical protein|uniref:Uncharacterized protein n=1 Tax=Pedobacter nutrimenti TaxID=1241337 RepID=A0A318UGL1_9SPHI|nr:hypothetical protein [Pedobacter nutrimenti]PYF71517.1 hypothetical protein B0O44_107132 [Pedobacter nutrimenti]